MSGTNTTPPEKALVAFAALPGPPWREVFDPGDDAAWAWFEPNARRYEPDRGAIFLRGQLRVTFSGVVVDEREDRGDGREPVSPQFVLVDRRGSVEMGLSRRVWRDWKGQVVFFLAPIVGYLWQFLGFVADFNRTFGITQPFTLAVCVRGTGAALMSGLAKGYLDPFDGGGRYRPVCDEGGLLVRRDGLASALEADEVAEVVARPSRLPLRTPGASAGPAATSTRSTTRRSNSTRRTCGRRRVAVRRVRIFLASPGDVALERKHAMHVAEELNHSIGSARGLVLQVTSWENDAVPGYGKDAQALLNDQIADMRRYDLFVGILWNRIGTKTPRAASGTVEEFERAARVHQRSGKPRIWLYFRKSPATFSTQEQLDQRGQVLAFKKRVQAKGLTWEYASPASFRDLFRRHLLQRLEAHAGGAGETTTRTAAAQAPASTGPARRTTPATGSSPGARVPATPAPSAPRRTPAARPAARAPTVSSSGKLLLLGGDFFAAVRVDERADGTIVVRIRPADAAQTAALRALKKDPFRSAPTTAYAYQNDAATVRVESVEFESVMGKTDAVLMLHPEDRGRDHFRDAMSVNGIGPDEIAEMRVRWLLLGEQPTGISRNDLQSIRSVVGWGDGDDPVFKRLRRRFSGPAATFLPRARLAAISELKASRAVADVVDLRLGPLHDGKLGVRFRGRRPRLYDNQAPDEITASGDCPLR